MVVTFQHINLSNCSNQTIVITENDSTSLFFKQWWRKISCALHMSVSACLAALIMQEYCTWWVDVTLVGKNAKMAYIPQNWRCCLPLPRSHANTLSKYWHFDTSANTLQLWRLEKNQEFMALIGTSVYLSEDFKQGRQEVSEWVSDVLFNDPATRRVMKVN